MEPQNQLTSAIFGPPIWWRQKAEEKKTIQWNWFFLSFFWWDEKLKIRCGIQVVACLHVKSIHQLNLIEWKQPKFDKRDWRKKAIKFHWKEEKQQWFLLVDNLRIVYKNTRKENRYEWILSAVIRNLLKYYSTIFAHQKPRHRHHTHSQTNAKMSTIQI